ncbi:hypothetical protein FOZ62_028073, partial [Perkinsus olseni]
AQDPPLRLSYAPPPHWEESRIGKAVKKTAAAEEGLGSTPMSHSEPTGSPDFLTGDDFLIQPSPSPSEMFPPGGSPAGSSLLTTESKSQYTHVVALRPRPERSSKSPARYNCRPRFRDLASARKSQHEVSVHSRTSAEWSRVMENRLKHAKEEYQQFFASNLFESTTVEARPQHASLGRPADQTTAEMFGDYQETEGPSRKDVAPEFVPRQPYASAHEKKLQEFRGSELLVGRTRNGMPDVSFPQRLPRAPLLDTLTPFLMGVKLQTRAMPMVGKCSLNDTVRTAAHGAPITGRLMAANETWYSVGTGGKSKAEDSTVAAKADRERNSSVMELQREHPHGRNQAQPKAAADPVAEEKRRNNMMYSDLFGRATPDCAGQEVTHQRRQDRPNGVGKSRLSGEGLFMEDNSSKVAWDEANRDQSEAWRVRQNHLRSSVHIGDEPRSVSGSPNGSPPRSPEVNDWNITELAVSGLKE